MSGGAEEGGAPALEIWGVVECTVNRVGDAYHDQLERSGHAHRLDDLDRFAELGIRALRYPVLWERTAPDGRARFAWADARLGRLRELGVRPIVGLVHRTAMEIAELPKDERAAALQRIQRSLAVELDITDPELIDLCNEGIATVLQQIEASGGPSGGHA